MIMLSTLPHARPARAAAALFRPRGAPGRLGAWTGFLGGRAGRPDAIEFFEQLAGFLYATTLPRVSDRCKRHQALDHSSDKRALNMIRSIFAAVVALALTPAAGQAQQGTPRKGPVRSLESCQRLAAERGFSSAGGIGKGQGRAKREFVKACMRGTQS